ncbi:hypothetical protein EJB05_21257, partial [Eragrostis curvula]
MHSPTVHPETVDHFLNPRQGHSRQEVPDSTLSPTQISDSIQQCPTVKPLLEKSAYLVVCAGICIKIRSNVLNLTCQPILSSPPQSTGREMSGASVTVCVLAVSCVLPASTPLEYAGHVKLSFLDAPFVATGPFQYVCLYELAGGDEFPAAVRRLKESLATTLALYLPLAGQLAYLADTGDVVVDCSEAGVPFAEATADGDSMDVRRLASAEAHDVPAFLSLVPRHDTRVLPVPVLSVQATQLPNGMALGLSVHHAVVDASALQHFMGAWAAASCGGSVLTKPLEPPDYSRKAITDPRGDELVRDIIKKVAPTLPVTNTREDYFTQCYRLARRTFYFGANYIRSLKQHINALASTQARDEAPKPVSTFVALSALGRTAFVRSKWLPADEYTYLIFQADLRARLQPPVGDIARVAWDPGGSDGDGGGAAGRGGDVDRAGEAPAPTAAGDRGRRPRFRMYDTADFGFGRPTRVDHVSMNHDGRFVLCAGKRDSEVQVTASIHPSRMDAFRAHINARPRPKF